MDAFKTPLKGSSDPSKKKGRCSFSHYGYSMVEGYCAVGIPLESVLDMKEELIGPKCIPKPTIVACEQDVLHDNPNCTNSLTDGAAKARKAALAASPLTFIPTVANWRERDMSTWVPNCMIEEFLLESGVATEADSCMEQVNNLITAYGWTDAKIKEAVVAAAMMMWYYHYPIDKLRSIKTAEEVIIRSTMVNADMRSFADTVCTSTVFKDCTQGTLTPAKRFVNDTAVPAATRYEVPDTVVSKSIAASPEKMGRMSDARKKLAERKRKRADVLGSQESTKTHGTS